MAAEAAREVIDDFASFGIRAFTTTRAAGTYGMNGPEPVADVMARWYALVDELHPAAPRFATARQVHGARVVVHSTQWEGWLRIAEADGHAAPARGTAAAVSIADCVPVFIAHPSGATALLHSGWRGTAGRILDQGVTALAQRGFVASELRIHLGPAICGKCYEVSPDVHHQVTGRQVTVPTPVDLRALIADAARGLGIRHVSTSPWCTRCHNDRFFSHRAGDSGRQIAVLVAEG
ncbi:MAG TPA: polyphenol oxidase family protein [Gemmatimonadaceae bacterium]|nr:polyphenol oxidase family protein [Gemmatimonadaceae bacterium]